MTTNKKAVQLIAEICRKNGVRKVVFSPGSRSSPLVIAFSQIPEIECIVIADERVAGYFALGMAQQLDEVVVVVCTSGTAVLNLTPAVCEAFYQRIRILALTADRPADAYLKGENQAIDQSEVMSSFTKWRDVIDTEDKKLSSDFISKQMSEAFFWMNESSRGPAHINILLSEPLYERTENGTIKVADEEISQKEFVFNEDCQNDFEETLQAARKKLLILGMRDGKTWDHELLHRLAKRKDVAIIAESTSNFHDLPAVWNADACIASLQPEEAAQFAADIIITFGNQIISKKIKSFFSNHRPLYHFDVPMGVTMPHSRDMFGALYNWYFFSDEKKMLSTILASEEFPNSPYRETWQRKSKEVQQQSLEYLSQIPFSDLKVFETLIKSFPKNANIQYGNSTPVRYSTLFQHSKSLTLNANRGTSGIDGCVSTAAGAAYANKRMTICVVGDVSFFYDSNALWNNYLSPDLRIIVINNGGGNIFRLIDGPSTVKDFEKYFETKHSLRANHLASMYGLPYYICASQSELDKTLETFYQPQNGKPAILEIITDGEVSAEVYRNYFKQLKNDDEKERVEKH